MATHSSHNSYKVGITVLLGESSEVQQPFQDVTFVMSRLTDIMGQSKIGQKIHHFGCGWIQGAEKRHSEVAKADVCVCVRARARARACVCVCVRVGWGIFLFHKNCK